MNPGINVLALGRNKNLLDCGTLHWEDLNRLLLKNPLEEVRGAGTSGSVIQWETEETPVFH